MKKEIRLAIVGSQFWEEIVDTLTQNCVKTLIKEGIKKEHIDIYKVPGSLEIPLLVKKLAKKGVYSAIITFGIILKGKTYHFEQIANECIRGCMDVSLKYEIPVIYEVLAVYDLKDAIERSVPAKKVGHGSDKGMEAALSALKMIDSLSKV